MNKAILMGRLTKDPEVRYSNSSEPMAIARYTIAVDRRFKREGEPDADFIPCVAFGKAGEFAEKYFKKGMLVLVTGRIQVRSWDDQQGQKHWSTEVILEDQEFAESKASFESRKQNQGGYDGNSYNNNSYNGGGRSSAPAPAKSAPSTPEGFTPINDVFEDDEDLPF